MRLRYRITLWLLARLSPGERATLWHHLGLRLNVAKDGRLDLGGRKSDPQDEAGA